MVGSNKAVRGMQLMGCALALITMAACSSDDSDEPSAGSGGAAGEGGESGMGESGMGGMGESGMGGEGGGDAGGMGGSSGTGGIPGQGTFTPTGEPLAANDMEWTWVDFPDSFCRDGSTAGLGLSLNSASDKVMIFMQGGGACFDFLTCATNPANAAMQKGPQMAGVFDRSQDANPVKDWNFVFVPYCTGDVHLGTKEDGSVESVNGVQKFVGRKNLLAYLNRIVPTFPDASQVLLTGISAGGFGAAANMEIVQWAFGDIPVTAIDDSGPPMASEYLPTCLQEKWRTTWGFDDSILQDCGDDCPDPNDYSIPYSVHVANKFPDRMGGLIETTNDSVITVFYGYGTDDCTGSFATPVPAETFKMGLLDYRSRIMELGANLGTYYVEGSTHTWLSGGAFYSQEVGGVKMVDWFRDIVEGTAAAHVGPE